MTKPTPKGTTQKPEAWVKTEVKKILKSYGKRVWYFMPQGSFYDKGGIPDFIICAGGRLLAVETKTDHGTVKPLQQMQIEQIKEAGGYAIVVRESTLDQFRVFMSKLMEKGSD